LTGADEGQATWLVFIGQYRFGIMFLIYTVGSRSGGHKRRGVGRLTGERIPVRCALELVDGEPPVVGDGDGVVDAMQKRTIGPSICSGLIICFAIAPTYPFC
jgi:hypothetical protein